MRGLEAGKQEQKLMLMHLLPVKRELGMWGEKWQSLLGGVFRQVFLLAQLHMQNKQADWTQISTDIKLWISLLFLLSADACENYI